MNKGRPEPALMNLQSGQGGFWLSFFLSKLFFSFEISVDSHAVVRNNTAMPFIQFP